MTRVFFLLTIEFWNFSKSTFSSCQVITIQSDELILEAFKRMRDNQIGGLPVVEGPKKKIVGNVSIRDIRYLLLEPELFSNFRYGKCKTLI